MNITLSLMNNLGDEIGDVGLDAVRVAPAGTETATPDLAGQMSQLMDRLNRALSDLSLVPALSPMEVQIAVSRALLQPTPRGIVIPLQVRAMDEAIATQATRGRSPSLPPGAASETGEWDGLFDLGTDEGVDAGSGTVPAGGKAGARASGLGRPGELDGAHQLDEWDALGETWGMDGTNDEEEGGWK